MSVRVCVDPQNVFTHSAHLLIHSSFLLFICFGLLRLIIGRTRRSGSRKKKNGAYFPCHSLHITSLCSPFLLLTRYSISLLLCFCFVPFIIIVIILVTLYGLAVSLFFRIIACSWFTVSNEPKTTLSVYFQLGALLLFLSICLAIFFFLVFV